MNAKDRKLKRLDQLESIAEEITLMMGLNTKVIDDSIEVETIFRKFILTQDMMYLYMKYLLLYVIIELVSALMD